MEFGNQPCGINCGTTILAMEFKDGVVIAADSRTACTKYICSRSINELISITDKIYSCRSGSASNTQTLAENVSNTLNNLEYQFGQPSLVKDAATAFCNEVYRQNQDMEAGIVVAGWDNQEAGQVYSIPISGYMVRQPYAVSGTGSVYIHGFVSSNYRIDMDREECVQFGQEAVRLAIDHDNYSGGVVRIAVITRDGFDTKVFLTEEQQKVASTNEMLWNLKFDKW